MAEIEDTHFETGDSGESATYPTKSHTLRKNGFVMLKGRPCQIVDISTSNAGENGHDDVHFVGIDIFTQKKYEDICPSNHNIDVPHVSQVDYQLSDIADDNHLTLMDDNGVLREDLILPEGTLGTSLLSDYNNGKELMVTVLKACGEEYITGFKINAALDN